MKNIKILLVTFLLFSNCFSTIKVRNMTEYFISITYEEIGRCQYKNLTHNKSYKFGFFGSNRTDNHLIIRADSIKNCIFNGLKHGYEYIIRVKEDQFILSEQGYL